MATAHALRQQEAPTVTSFISRAPNGQLRVSFSSPDANGFSLDELDALQHAITVARRQISDATPSEPTELRLFEADDAETRYQEQLSRMAAPT